MAQILTDLLRYRIGIAAEQGANPAEILQLAGVDPDLMTSASEYQDASEELKIWRAIVELTGREDIGLVCGNRFPTQVISMIGYVMANSPDLGTAIGKLCGYQRLIGDTMGMKINTGNGLATCSIELWSDWFDPLRYTIDMFMAATLSWIAGNTPGKVWPLEAGFHYERPRTTEPYSALFAPAPVDFGCAASNLVYRLEDMDVPILGANMTMFEFFDHKVKQAIDEFEGRDTFSFRVRQQILRLMKGNAPSINDVAGVLAVSARTLQKHLKDEGASFSGLLNQARRDLAIEYLKEKQVSHAEIAYLLGFSEVSVFSRSFKKWTGLSPSEYVR